MNFDITKMAFRYQERENDIHSIAEIVKSTGFFYDDEANIAVELIRERLEKGCLSEYYFVFADYEEKTLAYSCYGPIPGTKSVFDLYWIVTHNDYRGYGIGRSLLQETEKRVKEMGGTALYAETSSREKYISTRMFYRKNVFTEVARIKDFYNTGDDKIIYVRQLV